jgi:ribosomal protein S18 acetylase RimI-like enzyme
MVPAVVTARRLEPEQRSGVAIVLADAFEHDPMQAWLFPNGERRRQRLRRFYERDLAVRLEGSTTTCLLGTAAVACWQAPGGAGTLPLRSALRLAPCFWSVAAHHPLAGPRLLAAVLRQRPDEPHWYLSHLAVRPGDRRRGFGRTLLQWGIERADEDGVGTYLETANPDNLPFYRSAGYAQVGLVRVDDAPSVWALWRGPAAASFPTPTRDPRLAAADQGATHAGPPVAGGDRSDGGSQ